MSPDGGFSLTKAREALATLEAQRQALARDASETILIERIQRDAQPHVKALSEAHEKGVGGESSVLRAMDVFLLTKMREVVRGIEEGRPEAEIRGLAQAFVRGYAPFYAPNNLRTAWNEENQPGHLFRRALLPRTIKKDDPRALEASNLAVRPESVEEIGQILEKPLAAGAYLAPEDVEALKSRGFDLSRLDPGVSTYWRRISIEDVDRARAAQEPLFPQPGERLTYEGPRYRSDFSPKFTVSLIRNGVKHIYKVKLGPEVHSDLIGSRLREYMGFFQDSMSYRETLLVHLGKKTYEQVRTEIGIKYGITRLDQSVQAHGEDPIPDAMRPFIEKESGERGEEWMRIKDCFVELRPEEEIRVSLADIGTYDGANRREVRCEPMISAFLGASDATTRNFRMVYARGDDGAWTPQVRFHDQGRSLGTTPVLQTPRDLLRFPATRNKIEEYERDYVIRKRNGDVKLVHNDTFGHERNTAQATYADFKWAARLLASLPDEVIERTVRSSGIPETLVPVYCRRIGAMKDRAIEAFELDRDVNPSDGDRTRPVIRSNFGPLSEVDNADVQKGKIKSVYYPNKNILPLLQETWFTFLNRQIGLVLKTTLPNFFESIDQRIKAAGGGHAGPVRLAGSATDALVSGRMAASTRAATAALPSTWSDRFQLTPLLAIECSRVVAPNSKNFAAEGSAHMYVVEDKVGVSLGVSSSVLEPLLKMLPLDASAQLKLLTRTFRHTHFADGVAAGYLSSLRILRAALGDLETFAARSILPGEVVRSEFAVGLTATAGARVHLPAPGPRIPLTHSGASVMLSRVHGSSTAYAKDFWGSLFLMREQTVQSAASADVDLAHVNLVQLRGSLARFHRARETTEQVFDSIEFRPRVYEQEGASNAVSAAHDEAALVRALKALRSDPELLSRGDPSDPAHPSLEGDIQLKYSVRARREKTTAATALAYVFNRDRATQRTDAQITTREGTFDFHRLERGKRGLAGFEDLLVDLGTRLIAVPRASGKRLVLQLDRENPRNLVLELDVAEYRRVASRVDVLDLIEELNRRNARDAATPFFRTDIPPSDETYRKIAALVRIYVNGEALHQIVERLTPADLAARIDKAFEEEVHHPHKLGIDALDLALTKRRACDAAKRLRAAVAAIEAAGRSAPSAEKEVKVRAEQDALAQAAFDFTYSLYKSKFSVRVLERVLGEDGVAIFGEIYGIHEQTNMLQDEMWKSALRFGAASRGEVRKQAPIDHFLRYEQPMPPTERAASRIPLSQFLGTLPHLVPPTMTGFLPYAGTR